VVIDAHKVVCCVIQGIRQLQELGSKRFGIHTFIASNELNADYFVGTAEMLFTLAADIKKETGVPLEFINMSGGIGIPYRPDDRGVDIEALGGRIRERYEAEKLKKAE
jgi:diaminopimelate decarboxylase